MTDEFSVVDLANSGKHSTQLLTTTRALQDDREDDQREGKRANKICTTNIVKTQYSNG